MQSNPTAEWLANYAMRRQRWTARDAAVAEMWPLIKPFFDACEDDTDIRLLRNGVVAKLDKELDDGTPKYYVG
jgi:hypothetical protein